MGDNPGHEFRGNQFTSGGGAEHKDGSMSPHAIATRINQGRADKIDLKIAQSHAASGHRELQGALDRHDAREAAWTKNHAENTKAGHEQATSLHAHTGLSKAGLPPGMKQRDMAFTKSQRADMASRGVSPKEYNKTDKQDTAELKRFLSSKQPY